MSQISSAEVLSADVIIVGGGVIGLSIARELAQRGVRNIAVVERGQLGQEASWAAGGILAPQVEADTADDFFQLARTSREMYPRFAQALREETGIDIELDQTGTLYAGFNEGDEQEMQRRYDWQKHGGLRVEWLTGDEARGLEPNLSGGVRCALRFADDWQVNNRKLIEALIAANENLGVSFMVKCEVVSIRVAGQSAIGVQTAEGIIDAPKVVLSAGAWTSHIQISGHEFTPIEIEPVRGQMLCFKTDPPIAHHVIYSSRGYLVPRRDGRLLAGSTSERVGFDKRVTNDGIEFIKGMACEIAPSLADEPIVESWAGFRPGSIDDLPLLGPAQGIDGLFYATGHYRNGILLAPVTAKLVADSFLSGNASALCEAFSPNRFCKLNA